MIRSMLITCAQNIIIDSQTNQVSLINIIEEISPPGFPIIFSPLVVLSMLVRDEEDPQEIDLTVIIEIDDQIIHKQTLEISFLDKRINRHIIRYAGLPIPNAGILKVSIFREKDLLHAYNVLVTNKNVQLEVEHQSDT